MSYKVLSLGLGMASVSYLTLVYTFDNTMLSVLQVLCMQCQRASVPFEASSARRSNIVFQAWGRLDVSKYATRIQIHHSVPVLIATGVRRKEQP